jgi:predicted HD superfamily hydrolase involved in NAD metabolism
MLDRTALYEHVKAHLSLPRFLHSVRTAEMVVALCGRSGLQKESGYAAGIAHDMARELPAATVQAIAREDGLPLLNEELQRPVLLHGRAAAVLLQRSWGEERNSVLDAVRWHTQGHPDMGELAKIIYIADYIEEGRVHISDEFRTRILGLNTIDEMVLEIMKAQFVHLKAKQTDISTYALQLFSILEERQYAKI